MVVVVLLSVIIAREKLAIGILISACIYGIVGLPGSTQKAKHPLKYHFSIALNAQYLQVFVNGLMDLCVNS